MGKRYGKNCLLSDQERGGLIKLDFAKKNRSTVWENGQHL
jgi:hypothetical protein